ncbi:MULTISPECIES: hypothetical protein [unclassified Mycobacterium]|uniref:hypothetical protein n=1 Tax=unclassified Mycobacterium TaxID=2642494 RepID=UPI0007FCF7BB|nr:MULTISPECIES: hypothetical protein [unclassified Mycobacterium]OBG58850.1 hypothetical protein A5703_02790 [Mycobacterium sp. E188]OBG68299.1 hypothetical protein A5704_00090 [Mycobacterium sp. E735]OBG71803.1 hypothetical protein A5701_26440 [Mycobacterium sp. E3305]OBG80867.1 hypothetical protein A9X05_20300 [Mycobacterium sp. E3298]OBH30587.1 hypothetical protein A9X03_08120 [Mycobacterium sp. E1715]
MSGGHSEIGPELRRLAQAILDGIDPAMRTAAALTAGRGVGTGKCQQVWCPVCALAALATGDQHPLITVIADHSIALLEVVRAMLDDINGAAKPPPDGPTDDGGAGPASPEATTRTRYQPIPVTVEE